jgi:adenylate cyclase
VANANLIGKLAVILHADIVGSTALVQLDEHKAHQRIQDSFQRFARLISDYHGQVRELRGDALLAEFERASDAVSAALAFQASQAIANADLTDDIRPVARVGIALGEVVIADDTITGAGVVLAQRLEQVSDPGGLCITPAIREALPIRLPFKLENLGERELKGFDEAVGIYRVSLNDGAAIPVPQQGPGRQLARKSSVASLAIVALTLVVFAFLAVTLVNRDQSKSIDSASLDQAMKQKPSIAVLPFNNLSGDPEQEYFADGISEDLTTDLSRISGLFVVARNSSFAYKGRSVDLRTVATELGVRYVLEGSVRRSGNQIRINAQLVDGRDGGHVWAERFDGSLADVFELQDEVNRRIVAALEVELTAADMERFESVETTNIEAYDQLLRGIEEYNRFTAESVAHSRVFFERAIALDPDYARAYANIALTHSTEVNFQWAADRQKSIRLGLEFAEKALALDASIPQIYLTRSILYLSQRQHSTALEAAQRTIEVHPNYADGQATLAFIQSYSGQFEAALESIGRARQINPQGTGVYLDVEGRTLFLLRRFEEAISVLEQALERNTGFDRIHLHMAATLAEFGRLEDAAWSIDEVLAISPETSLSREQEESLYQNESDIEFYLEALRKAGLPP